MRVARERLSRGYTLVELLVASALTLMLMTAVVQVFSSVGNGISSARRALEQFDRLRAAEAQLRMDLQGVTVTMQPPRRLEAAEGYFELIQGSIYDPTAVDATGKNDSTVGRRGDILMFTTRSSGQPFVGRYYAGGNGASIQSYVAEVAWFLRGRTLHRRVLLVAPGSAVQNKIKSYGKTFFADNDISARMQGGNIVPNTLADLMKRECRFAHPVDKGFAFDAARWSYLGLPTLRECSSQSWMGGWTAGTTPPPPSTPPSVGSTIDMWGDTPANDGINVATKLPDTYLGTDGTRLADDVVLTNVIGFDVKAWDYQAQQYVDLAAKNAMTFSASGTTPAINGVPGTYALGAPTYDTWSQSYENEGTKFDNQGNHVQDANAGRSTNGFDDNSTGIVDNMNEQLTSPPYLAPLRGIQVKIRCFEPDSRQVREVTVEQDFLPK